MVASNACHPCPKTHDYVNKLSSPKVQNSKSNCPLLKLTNRFESFSTNHIENQIDSFAIHQVQNAREKGTVLSLSTCKNYEFASFV